MKLSDEDIEWVEENYPKLSVAQGEDSIITISGRLPFDMLYEADLETYHINPNPEIIQLAEGVRIQDEFEIQIEFGATYLPQVFETGGRIERNVQDKKMSLSDLHVNGDGSACLCVKTEEKLRLPESANLSNFFYDLLIPFFYAQSYFEKKYTWPWGQYDHGVFGLLEWYADNPIEDRGEFTRFLDLLSAQAHWHKIKMMMTRKKGAKGHLPCICGSRQKIRECHQYAWRGIKNLAESCRSFGLHKKRK